jgi:hypothetical protein
MGILNMNTTRITASILGVFAGLGGGVFHGIGEILQGNVTPDGLYIQAYPAMQATAGEPALTVVPNFLYTGILSIIMGVVVTLWAALYIKKKNGGLVLILLSMIMFLVGGGIIPPIIGVIGGIIGTKIKHD